VCYFPELPHRCLRKPSNELLNVPNSYVSCDFFLYLKNVRCATVFKDVINISLLKTVGIFVTETILTEHLRVIVTSRYHKRLTTHR